MVTSLVPVGVVDADGVVFGGLVTPEVGFAVGLVVGLVFGGLKLNAPDNTSTVGTRMITIKTTARIANSFLREFGDGGGGGGGKFMFKLKFLVRWFFNI